MICLRPHSKEVATQGLEFGSFASKPKLLPRCGVLILKEQVLLRYAMDTPYRGAKGNLMSPRSQPGEMHVEPGPGAGR